MHLKLKTHEVWEDSRAPGLSLDGCHLLARTGGAGDWKAIPWMQLSVGGAMKTFISYSINIEIEGGEWEGRSVGEMVGAHGTMFGPVMLFRRLRHLE